MLLHPKVALFKKNYELALFLRSRLTWTQNSFIMLISKIRCIFFTLVFCSKNVYFSHNFIEKPFAYVTILLLYNYHTAIIRWIPLTVHIFRSVLFKKALNSLVKCVLGVLLMLCAYQSTFLHYEWGFMLFRSVSGSTW